MRRLLALLVILQTFVAFVVAAHFEQCLSNFKASPNLTDVEKIGARDNNGNKVDFSNATALMYTTCLSRCGSGQEPPDWSVFSKQFAAWLLPWLALISQLPFGATYRLDNIISMLLTVGSPALAAYSLVLTVLNGHYVAKRFAHIQYPNAYYAVRVLASMQQSPLRIMTDDGLLASLVVLPENDRWWSEMTRLINYEHTWTLSAFSSIAWVFIAYVFTVVDSFSDIEDAINSNGQAVGSLWLWLVPIVVGWLQISPKCDSHRLNEALEQANSIAYVATNDPNRVEEASSPKSGVGALRAFMFARYHINFPLSDEVCTPPVYNYSRFFAWEESVERVAEAFDHASRRAEHQFPVDNSPGNHWVPSQSNESIKSKVNPRNRCGTLDQVTSYCSPRVYDIPKSRWRTTAINRMIIASAMGLFLQWATTGSAIVIVWFTPTSGLGCRSGAYLLYGIGSTIIWALMVVSSVLDRCSANPVTAQYNSSHATQPQRIAARSSVLLRRLAKVLAAMNSVWIVATCMFQFMNVFNTCYCNSSVLGRGAEKAYNVIDLGDQDKPNIVRSWISGVSMALTAVFSFIGFVKVFLDTPLPSP